MRKLFLLVRAIFMGLALIAAPVSVASLSWGIYLLLDHMPMALWGLVVICNIICFLGIGFLIDTRREKAGLPPL